MSERQKKRRVKIKPYNQGTAYQSQCQCCGGVRKFYGGLYKTNDDKRRCCDESSMAEDDYWDSVAHDADASYHYYMERDAAKWGITYKNPYNECSRCRGGGCPQCEPRRFL